MTGTFEEDYKKTNEMFSRELQGIVSNVKDPAKQRLAIDAATKRHAVALSKIGASQAFIDANVEFIKSIQGKEVEGISALMEATKGRVKQTQDLQGKFADQIASTSTMGEKAVAGIASFASVIATVLRFFGADDMAQTIEDKAAEITRKNTASMEQKLDHSVAYFKNKNDEESLWTNRMKDVGQRFKNSTAPERAKQAAEDTTNTPIPTGSSVYTNPVSLDGQGKVANTPITWNTFKENLATMGLNKQEIDAFVAPWAKSTAHGEKMKLDSQEEAAALLASPAAKGLAADKQKKVSEWVLEYVPK